MLFTEGTTTGRRGGFNLIGSFWCSRERLFQKQNPYGVDWANIETTYHSDRWMWTARIDWHRTRVDVDGESEQQAIDNAIEHFKTWADRVLHSEDIKEITHDERHTNKT